jgi:hypothetical protein
VIEGDESRSMGDRVASAAAAAGRRRGAGEQDGAYRLGVMLREKEYQPRAMAA